MGIGFSLFLIAAGAILAFAVEVTDATIGSVIVEWDTVGVICMVAGGIGLVWSLYLVSSFRENRMLAERRPNDEIRA